MKRHRHKLRDPEVLDEGRTLLKAVMQSNRSILLKR